MPNAAGTCATGWSAIGRRLHEAINQFGIGKKVVLVECYPGVAESEVLAQLAEQLKPQLIVRAWEALRTPPEIDRLCQPFLGGGDPVFGFLSPFA